MRERLASAAKIASAQKGALTRAQLLDADWSASAIGRWVDKGLLMPEYPGVYRFGHAAPSTEATYMAAVLAAGDGALLARRAAGHLMRLSRGGSAAARSSHAEKTAHQGEAVLARRPNSKGAKELRAIMRGKPLSLSRLERAFLKLCKQHNLALPETKLTVELDSYRYHSSRHAWEQDRKRERQARKRGDDFRRFTSDDVFEDPEPLLSELSPLVGKPRKRRRSPPARARP